MACDVFVVYGNFRSMNIWTRCSVIIQGKVYLISHSSAIRLELYFQCTMILPHSSMTTRVVSLVVKVSYVQSVRLGVGS